MAIISKRKSGLTIVLSILESVGIFKRNKNVEKRGLSESSLVVFLSKIKFTTNKNVHAINYDIAILFFKFIFYIKHYYLLIKMSHFKIVNMTIKTKKLKVFIPKINDLFCILYQFLLL